MPPSATIGPQAKLSGLSWKNWLLLVINMSAIGSTLMIAALLAHHFYILGLPGASTPGVTVHHSFFLSSPLELWFSYFLLSLTMNLCGALALMAFFVIRRRAKRS